VLFFPPGLKDFWEKRGKGAFFERVFFLGFFSTVSGEKKKTMGFLRGEKKQNKKKQFPNPHFLFFKVVFSTGWGATKSGGGGRFCLGKFFWGISNPKKKKKKGKTPVGFSV